MCKGAPDVLNQSASRGDPRRSNWLAIVAGVVSVICLIVCCIFEERDPHSDTPSAIALLIGIACGLIIMIARGHAQRAREGYRGDLDDHAHDTLWPINFFWIALTITTCVPAIPIWILPILKRWPHGVFYYTGGAVGIFVIVPIIRWCAEKERDQIITG